MRTTALLLLTLLCASCATQRLAQHEVYLRNNPEVRDRYEILEPITINAFIYARNYFGGELSNLFAYEIFPPPPKEKTTPEFEALQERYYALRSEADQKLDAIQKEVEDTGGELFIFARAPITSTSPHPMINCETGLLLLKDGKIVKTLYWYRGHSD